MRPLRLRLPAFFFIAALSSIGFAAEKPEANAWDLPPFNLPGLDGRSHTLADWKGDVILLNFWATWCRPCQAEMPRFQEYQVLFGDRGFHVVAVGLDEERKLRNFARTLGLEFPILVADPEKDLKLLRIWGDIRGILPHSVVIGRDGAIHYVRAGILDEDTFDRVVAPLINAP